ncbi:hypothetical protein MEO40_27590, partial [Dolichospermum sp. ST_sed1]|nr:hypothetical protein [Dolichospermum sp. ST_sed1]
IHLPQLTAGMHKMSFKIKDGANQKVGPCAERELIHTFRPKSNPKKIIGLNEGFALLREDGSVSIWGNSTYKLAFDFRKDDLFSDIVDIADNGKQFWALNKNGTIKILNTFTSNLSDISELEKSLKDIVKIIPMHFGIAAIDKNGKLFISFNENRSVIKSSFESIQDSVQEGVVDIRFNKSKSSAFVIKKNREAIYFGNLEVDKSTYKEFKDVVFTDDNFALLKNDFEPELHDSKGIIEFIDGSGVKFEFPVKEIKSILNSFMAITINDDVYEWKSNTRLPISKNIKAKKIESTTSSYAILNMNNEVITFGNATTGGDSSSVSSELKNIQSITAGPSEFFALSNSDKLIYWGNLKQSEQIKRKISSDVKNVIIGTSQFFAIKKDGEVVGWDRNGNNILDTETQKLLNSSTKEIIQSKFGTATAVIKTDGNIITFGQDEKGGVTKKSELVNKDTKSIIKNIFGIYTINSSDKLNVIAQNTKDFPKFEDPIQDVYSHIFLGMVAITKNGKVINWDNAFPTNFSVPVW